MGKNRVEEVIALNPMWWLVSLVIAGAVIYYLVASRGEIRDGEGRRLATPGADEEVGEELSGEMGEIVAGIEDDESFVNPALDNTPVLPITNLDAAAGVASRGMGGIADEDEEYGADLDTSVKTLTGRRNGDDGEDEDEVFTEDEPIIEGREKEKRLEDETYMLADDVKRETHSTNKKVREFRKKDLR
jgi:hypothetical protein